MFHVEINSFKKKLFPSVIIPPMTEGITQSVLLSVCLPVHLLVQIHVQPIIFSSLIEGSSELNPLSVCVVVVIGVVLNFSQFNPLLQNHWANFNQTWHRATFGEGDLSLFT